MPSATVFLAGAECPFSCVFCDLWRYTLEGATPPGALPRQLETALRELPPSHRQGRVKLYNASNFFEERAVPAKDLPRLAALLAPFERVVVECHARLVDDACAAFDRLLEGRLELALGLEVADDRLLELLGKSMTLEDLARAAATLHRAEIPWRAFVLLGAPYVADGERLAWALRSVSHAFEAGAERVTLIPTRGGNGAMEVLAEEGLWRRPDLAEIEEALGRALELFPGRVAADLWDLAELAHCEACFEAREDRLRAMNIEGRRLPREVCHACSP